jgi:uncharacterized membrane protein
MALHHIWLTDGPPPPAFALWLRLPLQALLIAWAYWLAREDRDRQGDTKRAPARRASTG